MSMCKKLLALLAVLALLAAVPVSTAAEEDPFADLFQENVWHSISTDTETEGGIGNGLAFGMTLNVSDAVVNPNNTYKPNSASYNGYTVKEMGAVLTNLSENKDNMTLDQVDHNYILRVEAKYIFEKTEDTCSFAARVIRIPEVRRGTAIFCRPYCILMDSEGQVLDPLYGDVDVYSFNKQYYEVTPEEKPVLDLSTLSNPDDKITAAATAEYVAIDPEYKESFKVNLTLENVSSNALPTGNIAYVLKDADGNELGTKEVPVEDLTPGESMSVEAYVPVATATIEQVVDVTYIPDITLPTIGSDIDVTKKKNRIRVSAAEASFNEDGTIHVALTFKNYTSNWITEETDYIQYTYYKADGTKIKTVKLYIGVIDTKKNPVKTFEFDLPATAAKVKITKSDITYWTEWA